MVIQLQDYLTRRRETALRQTRRMVAVGGSRARPVFPDSRGRGAVLIATMLPNGFDPWAPTFTPTAMDLTTLYAEASLI